FCESFLVSYANYAVIVYELRTAVVQMGSSGRGPAEAVIEKESVERTWLIGSDFRMSAHAYGVVTVRPSTGRRMQLLLQRHKFNEIEVISSAGFFSLPPVP